MKKFAPGGGITAIDVEGTRPSTGPFDSSTSLADYLASISMGGYTPPLPPGATLGSGYSQEFGYDNQTPYSPEAYQDMMKYRELSDEYRRLENEIKQLDKDDISGFLLTQGRMDDLRKELAPIAEKYNVMGLDAFDNLGTPDAQKPSRQDDPSFLSNIDDFISDIPLIGGAYDYGKDALSELMVLPDLVTAGPGGVTAVFGTPSGKPILSTAVPGTTGRTWTGGATRVGVITGNPAVDAVLASRGYEGLYDIPTQEDILEILKNAGGVTGVLDAVPDIKGFTPDEGTDKKTEFGVTLDGGPDKDDLNKGDGGSPLDDNKGGSSLDDDKGGGGSPLDDKGGSPYLDLNKGDGSDPDKGTSTTGGGGDGGGGAGYTQGIGIHSGDPGDIVDLDYLYDISGSSIFAPRLQDEGETDDNRPYVYAKSGGMIHNNYDLTDEILRRLIRGR